MVQVEVQVVLYDDEDVTDPMESCCHCTARFMKRKIVPKFKEQSERKDLLEASVQDAFSLVLNDMRRGGKI